MNKLKKILLEQLKQGATPEKLALTVAFGVTLGIIPILGITTWLCLLAAMIFKLNHVVIQVTHHVIYPLQLLLVIPYCRLGEKLFGAKPIPLNIKDIYHQFEQDFVLSFKKYAATGLMGGVVWLLSTPLLIYVTYWIALTVLRKLKSLRS